MENQNIDTKVGNAPAIKTVEKKKRGREEGTRSETSKRRQEQGLGDLILHIDLSVANSGRPFIRAVFHVYPLEPPASTGLVVPSGTRWSVGVEGKGVVGVGEEGGRAFAKVYFARRAVVSYWYIAIVGCPVAHDLF